MRERSQPLDHERIMARERDMLLLDIDMRRENTLQQYAQRHIGHLLQREKSLYTDVLHVNAQD